MSLIRVEQLYKAFGRQQVLSGLDLGFNAGEAIVIIGQSGSGKSVLLKHLIGLMEPDSGHIYIDDDDITSMNFKAKTEMRQRFGMLFQSAALFDSMTVMENVGLGLKESRKYKPAEIEEIVMEKLTMVGLADAARKEPSQLSGGMRKRVGLARAIAHNPEILLYDEPTTGLDPVTADKIDDIIIELHEKLHVTSIAVTHDMKSAFKIGKRIIMLYQGKVEFDGSPEEINVTDNPVVKQFITGTAEGPIKV